MDLENPEEMDEMDLAEMATLFPKVNIIFGRTQPSIAPLSS